MALQNEILVGRFNRGLQKLFSIKGGPPVAQIGGDLIATFPLPVDQEFRYLNGWQTFGSVTSLAAVAAQSGFIQLRNPANSGVVGLVIKAAGESPVATVVLSAIGPATAQGSALGFGRFDARGAPRPTLIATSGTAAAPDAGLGDIWQVPTAAGITAEMLQTQQQEIPLLPGDAFVVFAQTANIIFNAYLWWRERPLEESERT